MAAAAAAARGLPEGAMSAITPAVVPWAQPLLPVFALRYISMMKRQNMDTIMMTPVMGG